MNIAQILMFIATWCNDPGYQVGAITQGCRERLLVCIKTADDWGLGDRILECAKKEKLK